MSPAPSSTRNPVRLYLGAPVSVGVVVALDRMPGDGDRDRIVAAAREAFDSEGRLEEGPGGFRWSTSRVAVEVVRPELDPQGAATAPSDGDAGSGVGADGPIRSMTPEAPPAEFRAGAHLENGELLPLLGVAVLGLNTLAALATALGLGPPPGTMLPVVALNALVGSGLFVWGQLRARRWSREARARLEQVARAARVPRHASS